MAVGSARLGQKVEVDQESIDEYNRANRPKKLIDMHKEMKEGHDTDKGSLRGRPLGGGKEGLIKNSAFFDFRSKMTKPSKTNQFL